MSDPHDHLGAARTARESLARGLNALQSDPNVPPALLDAAQPIAQAMGALMQIEKGAPPAQHAETALAMVRSALSQLQAQPASHPAVGQAMEAVAGSLGLVHSLAKSTPAAAPAPNPAFAATAIAQPAFPQQASPAAYAQTAVAQPAFPQHAAPQPAPLHLPQQPAQPAPLNLPQQPAAKAPAPTAQAKPNAGPPGALFQAPPTAPAANAIPSPPPNDLPLVEAPLGAHSPTNFYKGLSGNDIVDHGGLFVATYKIPKIGTKVRLKVSLPGGYEFEADCVVRWSRSDGGPDAPPGFGAQIALISPEARQLIYRYVRNREPLFHDDL